MTSIKSITRISLTLGLLTACVVWSAIGLRLVPNPFNQAANERGKLCQSVAITAQHFANDENALALERYLGEIFESNPSLKSIGVRKSNGELEISVGPHNESWQQVQNGSTATNQMSVDIANRDEKWGKLEFNFKSLDNEGVAGFLKFPFPLILFCGCAVVLANWLYFTKVHRSLRQSKVVSDKVRTALDSLTEGILLTDRNEQIVLANDAFAKIVGMSSEQLDGASPTGFRWRNRGINEPLPWTKSLEENHSVRGKIIAIETADDQRRTFVVNTTPISSENGSCGGVLTSFDDITEMEQKKEELANMLAVLQKSRDEIRRQNEELQVLASRDSLTGCFNRRSFFEKFEELWDSEAGKELSVMMVDIDHFKSINDNYGHVTGDHVLRHVGTVLRTTVDELASEGVVCRYGGEEFCVLIPDMGPGHATAIAETLREEVAENKVSNIAVTTSIGVSSRSFGAMDQQHALDQADQSLYVAKRMGRNQVVRWDECQDQVNDFITERESAQQEGGHNFDTEPARTNDKTIQYPAVTALLSALAFRDRDTAMHCSRVSHLCVSIARDLMTPSELYSLEIAALLHDIGKIGVPDEILFKPGQLSENEWQVMNRYHDIGVEIARSAFTDEEIAQIIGNYHSVYRNVSDGTDTKSARVLLASKILLLCDCFDAMVSDKVYAKGMSQQAALMEIRKHVPDKYDEALVERLAIFVEQFPNWHEFDQVTQMSKQTAVVLGGHIAQFSDAIADSDIDSLRKIVQELKQTARKAHVDPVVDAAIRLQEALHENETELTQVMELTSEVMDLCRSTRSVIMNTESDQNP